MSLRLTTQAQRPGPRGRSIATVTRWPSSLQRMVERSRSARRSKERLALGYRLGFHPVLSRFHRLELLARALVGAPGKCSLTLIICSLCLKKVPDYASLNSFAE